MGKWKRAASELQFSFPAQIEQVCAMEASKEVIKKASKQANVRSAAVAAAAVERLAIREL